MTNLEPIKSSALFHNMTEDDRAALAAVFIEKPMAEGAMVFVENMPGESLFFIRKGSVKISKMIAEGEEKILVVLGADEFFGEMAIFDDAPRAATARVAEAAELLCLKKSDFEHLCETNPRLALKLTRNIFRAFHRLIRENEEECREMLLWSLGRKA